jgi:hypothetical protein
MGVKPYNAISDICTIASDFGEVEWVSKGPRDKMPALNPRRSAFRRHFLALGISESSVGLLKKL